VFALAFLIPVILLELSTAIVVSVVWGLSVLATLSHKIARSQGPNCLRVIAEHLAIALAVIVITHFVGDWISVAFK
jgi:VIT1/CCC1 family predicted Fe2+/Mn2+ transporter